jgi:hypothetical protein
VKWLALLGVIVAAGAAALIMRGGPAPPVQLDATANLPVSPAAAPVPAPVPAPTPAPAATATAAAPWQRIELRGVLFQQNNPAASQALLSQDGQRAQVFRSGEEVLPGWTLQSIAQDHVIVAKGSEQHRLDVMQTASASASAPAPAPRLPAPAAAVASTTKPVTLPGFIPAPSGRPLAAPPSLETNRRFLQDRRNRQAGTAQ